MRSTDATDRVASSFHEVLLHSVPNLQEFLLTAFEEFHIVPPIRAAQDVPSVCLSLEHPITNHVSKDMAVFVG